MRTLRFCSGCGILLSEKEQELPTCFNCDTPTEFNIPGDFTNENAEKLETAYMDQTQ